MEPKETNGRTHEPSLREITSELDGFKALFLLKIEGLKEICDLRDQLYKERDEAHKSEVDRGFTALREQTQTSFTASEKAIVKAETAQREYNLSHNDLLRKMDEQIPRSEYLANLKNNEDKFADLKKEIAVLRDDRSVSKGQHSVSDVGMLELIREVKTLVKSDATSGGIRTGGTAMWGYIVGGIGLGILLLKFLTMG